MGGKAGRKRRHFLRPGAAEEEKEEEEEEEEEAAHAQLPELHKNEWQDNRGRLMGTVGERNQPSSV